MVFCTGFFGQLFYFFRAIIQFFWARKVSPPTRKWPGMPMVVRLCKLLSRFIVLYFFSPLKVVWGIVLVSMNYMSIILYEFCITSIQTFYQSKLAGCLFCSTDGATQVFCAVMPPLCRFYFSRFYFSSRYISGGKREIISRKLKA